MEYIARYTQQRCRTCGLGYLPVGWLEWRTRGYCTQDCDPTEVEVEEDQFDLFAQEDACG